MSRPRNPHPTPSPRALQILELMAHGMSLREVAIHLFISESTAKTHMQQVHAILGARTTTHAVAVAISEGLITAPAPRTLEQRAAVLTFPFLRRGESQKSFSAARTGATER